MSGIARAIIRAAIERQESLRGEEGSLVSHLLQRIADLEKVVSYQADELASLHARIAVATEMD